MVIFSHFWGFAKQNVKMVLRQFLLALGPSAANISEMGKKSKKGRMDHGV
jgi:hypothetical protein